MTTQVAKGTKLAVAPANGKYLMASDLGSAVVAALAKLRDRPHELPCLGKEVHAFTIVYGWIDIIARIEIKH
jgi:hypothetical protein